jgi:hypothetical protein
MSTTRSLWSKLRHRDARLWFTPDGVVSRYSFGHDENILQDELRASTLRRDTSELLLEIKYNQQFPWIVDALNSLLMVLFNEGNSKLERRSRCL